MQKLLLVIVLFFASSGRSSACVGYNDEACYFTADINGSTRLFVKVTIDGNYWTCLGPTATWYFDVASGSTPIPSSVVSANGGVYTLDCGVVGSVPSSMTVNIHYYLNPNYVHRGTEPVTGTCGYWDGYDYTGTACWYTIDSVDGGTRYMRIKFDPNLFSNAGATGYPYPRYVCNIGGTFYSVSPNHYDGTYLYFDISSLPALNCYGGSVRWVNSAGNAGTTMPGVQLSTACECTELNCYSNFSMEVKTLHPATGGNTAEVSYSHASSTHSSGGSDFFQFNIPPITHIPLPMSSWYTYMPNGYGSGCREVMKELPDGGTSGCTTCRNFCYQEMPSPVDGCDAPFDLSMKTKNKTQAQLTFTSTTPAGAEHYTVSDGVNPTITFPSSASINVQYGAYTVCRYISNGPTPCVKCIQICLSAADVDPTPFLRKRPAHVPEEFVTATLVPNPTSSETNLEYSLVADAAVQVLVVDALGRVVHHSEPTFEVAGSHKMRISVNDLASGIYVVKLKVGTQVLTNRLSVIK